MSMERSGSMERGGEVGALDGAFDSEGLMTIGDVSTSKLGETSSKGVIDTQSTPKIAHKNVSGESINWDAVRLEPGESVPVSEAMTPSEFIAALELNAGLKVRVQQRFEALSAVYKHAEDIGNNQLLLQTGRMPTALYDAQLKTIAELNQSLPQLVGVERAALINEYVARLKMMVSNKRYLLYKTSGEVMRSLADLGAQGAQILDDPVALNKAIAASLFEKMYGVVPEMPLMYSEGEIGVVFACDSEESVGKLFGKVSKAVVSSNKGIRGFQALSQVKDSSNDKLVIPVTGMVLVSATPMDSLSLTVRKSTYRHENQHSMDYKILSGIDSKRLKHFSERISDPIDSTILEDLKSEIYALYDGSGLAVHEMYEILINPKGAYNYKGILGTKGVENVRGPYDVPTKEQLQIENYKELVIEATVAIDTLSRHYAKAYPGNDAWAKRMAIAMLDSYPVQDWSALAIAVERFGNNKGPKVKAA